MGRSSYEIRVILLKHTAETFNGNGYPVIALKAAAVSGINGRFLSFTHYGTLKRNSDLPEAQNYSNGIVNVHHL
jgi:hypothetical protein